MLWHSSGDRERVAGPQRFRKNRLRGKRVGAVILSPSFGRRTPVVRCYCCTRELPGSFAALRMTAFQSFSAALPFYLVVRNVGYGSESLK